ncbi:MAG: guanylate kinase [Demequina sp.]
MSRLLVLAGPTAVGKGTVVRALRQRRPDVWVSVSVTTRPQRPGETDGVDYHFVTGDEFSAMIERGELLEWAVVHGTHRYGTPRQPVLEQLANDVPAILEIDLQGARQVKETMPQARFVFLAPPSWETLVERLIGRGTEGADEQERRLGTAREEMAAQDWFDDVVINDSLEQAVDHVERLIDRSR